MQGPERATPPAARFEPTAAARVARGPATITNYVADAVWSVLHALGAHRWRDGYETDMERGWSRYRGSRCTVCDSPWEGW
jgi:hypothetical protein